MAALDDLVGALVFFIVIAFVSAHISTADIPVFLIILLVFTPVIVGVIIGLIFALIIKKISSNNTSLVTFFIGLLVSAMIGFVVNGQLGTHILNFMLIGMSYTTAIANMIEKEKLDYITNFSQPLVGVAMMVVILNLAAPLDYHLIFGAGLYTVIYIVARAIGKYLGSYFGASITHAPDTVKKYLGFTLLPHSGVSLVFTG